MGSQSLLQGIFLTQGSNLSLLHCRQILYHLSHEGGPDTRKDRGQEVKGATEDEMVGWYYRLSGREFEQTPGDSKGQGNLACCSPWGHKKSDMTEKLNTATYT